MEIFTLLSVVDWIVIGFVLLNALWGLYRGLSGELAGLFSIGAAFFTGLFAHGPISDWLTDRSRLDAPSSQALAFIGTVVVVFLAMLMARFVFKRFFELVGQCRVGLSHRLNASSEILSPVMGV